MPVYHQQCDAAMHPFPKSRRSHLTKSSTEDIHCPTISQFDTLPTELQIEIFGHCFPTFPRFDITEGPLLLSRICKAWKVLVYGTPKLWSSFEIEFTGSRRESASVYDVNTVDTMNRWLKRSKNYPLSVRLAHLPSGRVPDQRSARLLAALIPQAYRWRNIELNVPASDIDVLQQSLPIDLPQLQALTVRLNGHWISDSLLDISTLNIPWHQLSILDLQLGFNNLPSLSKCLEILSQTINLERFTANADCRLEEPGNFTKQISLLKLETLDIALHGGSSSTQPIPAVGRSEADLTNFLSRLSVPRLRNLRLGWFVRQAAAWSSTHSSFAAFLRTVAQTVQSVSIRYLPCSGDELVQLMSAVPNVTHMDLRFSLGDPENDPITDQFFTQCTAPTERAAAGTKKRPSTAAQAQLMLPLLQSLNMQCYGKRYSTAVLAAFLDSRVRMQASEDCAPQQKTLALFHLLSVLPVLPSMDKRLMQYRHDGLDISMDALVVR